jgi:hypothetical protein
MSIEQLIEWQKDGHEIACHGSTHKNTAEDVINNIIELRDMGLFVDNIGFASPESWLTNGNMAASGIERLYSEKTISYMRTGTQILREGVVYTALSLIEQITHSSILFYSLNSKNIICAGTNPELLPSVAVKNFTSLKQIKFLIKKMKDGDKVILMFHSILYLTDPGYGADHYYWDAKQFDSLCSYITTCDDINVCTTYQLVFNDN